MQEPSAGHQDDPYEDSTWSGPTWSDHDWSGHDWSSAGWGSGGWDGVEMAGLAGKDQLAMEQDEENVEVK